MHIVFNTDQIYLHGGVEKVLITKANYWAKVKGYQVSIITTEQLGLPSIYALDKQISVIDLGVNYVRTKSYFAPVNLVKSIRHFFKHRRALHKLMPDVIISPNYNFDHYWLPFLYRKSKVIKEWHGTRFFEQQARLNASFITSIKFFVEDFIIKRYDTVVVLNRDEAKYVPSKKVAIIPNPISPQLAVANISSPKVIAAGRLSPVKNFEAIIAIWSRLKKEFPDWQLHIYGQDYNGKKQELLALIEQHELQNQVIIFDAVPDLITTMCDYSIYAMTSISECFPMVLLEAKSVGLPIVSYDCPHGPRNIIKDGKDGVLIPNNNEQEFVVAMKTLMEDADLRSKFAKEGKESIIPFNLANVMELWEKILPNR